MKTDVKTVQILISLLKQFEIKHIVISPGTRHVAFVHCVESDPFFNCYSVVDERSAAFLALGLSKATNKPVCFVCTSSTASCNYMPAMQQAYEEGVKLVALTADKSRYSRYHGASQVIDQVNMYYPYCKYAVDVPIVNNDDDYWFCNRNINEALLELDHHGTGPVQINFLEPLSVPQLSTFSDGEIPVTRKISRWDGDIKWKKCSELLRRKNRILVICGQYYTSNDTLNDSLKAFSEKYNAVISYENFSNVRGEGFILNPLVSQTLNTDEVTQLKPDLIITYGTKAFTSLVPKMSGLGIEQWDINDEGRVFDSTRELRHVFECTPETFFSNLAKYGTVNNHQYLDMWKTMVSMRNNSIDEYSNLYVAKSAIEKINGKVLIHTSVLNSMKFVNYYELPKDISVFGNICADGIDGALSTFLGQANIYDGLSLLIIGDLSFLYDLNAIGLIKSDKIRVLLINNYAGGEFHYNISKQRIDTLDLHIAAGHNKQIVQTSCLADIKYLSAKDKQSLENALTEFYSPSKTPVLLEVFTDANNDGITLRSFLKSNQKETKRGRRMTAIRKIVGDKTVNYIKKVLKHG